MPPLVKKNRETRYQPVSMAAYRDLVLEHHYSHRLPSAIKFSYGDVDYGPPKIVMACCLFSLATGRWEEELWELTRLVRLPSYTAPLTKLIGKAIGHIRSTRAIDLIVSFADLEEDHHGGIYQACSWVYDGIRETRLDGFNIDGEFVPARTCNALYGTSSVDELPKRLEGKLVVPHFDSSKHCYWKALSKEGMRKAVRLGFSSRPYPKPMVNGELDRNLSVEPIHRKGLVRLPSQIAHDGPQATIFDEGVPLL